MAFDAVLRQAREEKGGSFVALVAVVHQGEVYPVSRLGPYPDGRSAGKAAETFSLDEDDILARIEAGTLTPFGEVADPDPDDEAHTPVVVEEDLETDPEPASADDGPDVKGVSPMDWPARVRSAFDRHERAEQDFEQASRDRDAAVLDAYTADDGAASYREIADWVGVTHQTVMHMAKRERERRLQEEQASDGAAGHGDSAGEPGNDDSDDAGT